MIYHKTCDTCGGELHTNTRRQVRHKGECAKAANRCRTYERDLRLGRKVTKVSSPLEPEKAISEPVYVDGVVIGFDPPDDYLRARQAQAIDRIMGDLGLNRNMVRNICSVEGLYHSMQ